MIINFLNELSTKSIILASSSPRRKEILDKLGITIQIIPSLFEENLNPKNFPHPSDFVKETAKGKTKEAVAGFRQQHSPVDLVIGADTCVVLDGRVFGKPKDEGQAEEMLASLSGRCHEVVTGVHLMFRSRGGAVVTGDDDGNNDGHGDGDNDGSLRWETDAFHETTTVTFAPLSQELIRAYVDTGEPMDKAGGYGIQGLGGALIQGIQGDYFNVMGFPLHKFTHHLLPILEKWRVKPSLVD